jgi:acyl-CoA hydrolase
MTSEAILAKPARAPRVNLAIITEPSQSNAFGTIHGGVIIALYVALDEARRRPRPVPPLLIETEADLAAQKAAQDRQATRLARRAEARGH